MIEDYREKILNEIPTLLRKFKDIKPLSAEQISGIFEKESQSHVPVIFPGGWINGLGILRGIGRQGIKSVVMDPAGDALCFYSKYAVPYQCNSIVDLDENKEQLLLNDLLKISNALSSAGKKPVLFLVASEKLLPLINKNLKELSKRFTFTADFQKQLFLEDKKVQLEVAQKAGIAIPKSHYVNDNEDFEYILAF